MGSLCLETIDALVFTGEIGNDEPEVREAICAGLGPLGMVGGLSNRVDSDAIISGLDASMTYTPLTRHLHQTPSRTWRDPMGQSAADDAVRSYVESIPPEHRPLFNRVQQLVDYVHPEATLVLSYKMPTYKVGKKRLYIGVWKHGVSIYGWKQGKEAAFSSKHPETKTSKGTIRLRPEDSAAISDADLRELVRAALDD